MSTNPTLQSSTSGAGGQVLGGEQPVTGATIQLLAASATGYGTASSLLATTTTDASGNFLFTTAYSCPTPTTPVYIAATQGNPGLSAGTNNAQLALMVALGPCQNLTPALRVVINELTTVAAVWALAAFATDFDHVGTSATNSTGLTNAFGMANVLVSPNGQLPGALPAGAVEPASELNTLADLLAYCVNSGGGVATDTSTPCGKLLNDVTPSGGAAPTNTVQAALDIALHPCEQQQCVWQCERAVSASHIHWAFPTRSDRDA